WHPHCFPVLERRGRGAPFGARIMTRVAVSASQSRGGSPASARRSRRVGLQTSILLHRNEGGVLIAKIPPSIFLPLRRGTLENSEFDAQEFLGVFAEIGDQQPHVAAEAG